MNSFVFKTKVGLKSLILGGFLSLCSNIPVNSHGFSKHLSNVLYVPGLVQKEGDEDGGGGEP